MYKKIIAGLGIGALLLQGGYVIGQNQNKDDGQNSAVIEELQNKLEEAEAKIAEVNLQLAQQSVDLDTARARVAEIENELANLEDGLAGSVDQCRTLMAEKKTLEELIATKESQIKQLELELTDLTIASGKTSASYFTFEGSKITGYNGPEELKDIIIPTHYSIADPIVHTSDSFTGDLDIEDYINENDLALKVFTLTFSNGEVLTFNGIEDFRDRLREYLPLFYEEQLTCVLTWEEQGFIDGYQYTVDTIGAKTFVNVSLTSIEIPAGITTLEDGCIAGCHADIIKISNTVVFEPLVTPAGFVPSPIYGTFGSVVCNIELDAYSNIPNYGTFSIIDGVLTVNNAYGLVPSSLQRFASLITDIDWASCQTSIAQFDDDSLGGSSLKTLVLPSTVSIIGFQAFCDSNKLTEVDLRSIPSACVINDNAFINCSALTTVYLPANLTQLPDSTFANCYALEKIYVPAGTLDYYKELSPTYADYFEELSE